MTTDSMSADGVPGSPIDEALKKLLAQSVGKAAGGPVWQALRLCLVANLPDDGGPINNPGGPQENGDSKITWAQYFFYNEGDAPALSASVGGYTGLTAADLASYANAVLTQSIYYYGNQIVASILDRDRINGDVASYGARMIGGVGLLGITAVSQDAQIKALADAARGVGATPEQFVQAVIAIIPSRILLYQDKHWVNGDLEIFDWLGQYVAIGGQLTDVGALLTRLYQVNLPEFPNLTAATINQYRGFLEQESGPSYTDFSDCTDLINYSPDLCVQGRCSTFDDWVSNLYLEYGAGQKYRTNDSSCCSDDTEILLADGRAKLVSRLEPGDVIQGAEGPVSPLYVSATPLNGRDLYEFFEPGEGPRLTRTHPIVNPLAGDDGAAAGVPGSLAVSPSVLRAMLPHHHRAGVGSLRGALVHTRTQSDGQTAAGASTGIVRGIRATPTSTHGAAVYDVVLPFSGQGRAAYWAGRQGRFMLVEPELVRLADDPLAGVAIFEFIAGLAARGAPGLNDAGDGPLQTELRDFLDVYGGQIYAQVFRAALCDASPTAAPAYALGEAGFAIDAFVREVGTTQPSLLAALGVLLETCCKHLYTPLSNVIRTAWRDIATVRLKASMAGTAGQASGLNVLALTMFDLEVLDSPATFGQAPWTVGVSIGPSRESAESDVRHQLVAGGAPQSSRFRQVFDQVLSYDLMNPNEAPWLSLDVVAAGQRTPVATSARLPVPMQMYGLRSVLLCDASGQDIARVNYDVRRMEAQPSIETDPGGRWDEADRLAYAVSFGRAMVGPMAAALARRTEALATRPTYFVNV